MYGVWCEEHAINKTLPIEIHRFITLLPCYRSRTLHDYIHARYRQQTPLQRNITTTPHPNPSSKLGHLRIHYIIYYYNLTPFDDPRYLLNRSFIRFNCRLINNTSCYISHYTIIIMFTKNFCHHPTTNHLYIHNIMYDGPPH